MDTLGWLLVVGGLILLYAVILVALHRKGWIGKDRVLSFFGPAIMMKTQRGKGAIAIIVAIVMVASPYGQVLLEEAASEGTHGMATLGYAFSAIFPGTVSLGSVSSHQSIVIGVSLPLRNSAQLSSFLQQVSTPGSPEYRHYLTPAEFTNTYSPSLSSYRAEFLGLGQTFKSLDRILKENV